MCRFRPPLAAVLLSGTLTLPGSGQEVESGALASLDDLLGIEISAAAKYAQTASEAAASVTVITREDIRAYGYRTLSDALVQVRGFYGTYDRNYFYLGSRGFGRPSDYNNRVLLLLDGQPINENYYASASLGSDFGLGIDMVERIEVVRGPGSALYGTSAMFGVVNVVTRKGNDIQGTHLQADMGSYGLLNGSILFGQEFASGLELTISANWRDATGQDFYFAEFDDPSTNNGMAEGQDWEEAKGAYAVGRYGPFSVRAYGFSREKAVPTAAWETQFNVEQTTKDEQWAVDALFEKGIGDRGEAMVRAYANGYEYQGYYPYEEDYLEDDGNQGRWYGVEGKLQWDFSAGNRLTIGTDLRQNSQVRYYLRTEGESYFDGDFPYSLLSAYAQDEINLFGSLVATLGLRLDHHSDVGSSISPRAALVFHPYESTTIKALWGEAFRAPNAYELYYVDTWGAAANPSLGPEEVRTLEATLEQRLSKSLFASVSFYDYEVRDLIDQVEIDLEEEIYQFQNQGEVHARGMELELNFRNESGFGGYVNYIHQLAETEPDDEPLSNSPRNAFRAGAHYPVSRQITMAASVIHDGERTTLWETETPSYTVANLTASARDLMGRFEVSVSVRNLFDEEYATPGGWEHAMPAIPQNGRNFLVSFGVSF